MKPVKSHSRAFFLISIFSTALSGAVAWGPGVSPAAPASPPASRVGAAPEASSSLEIPVPEASSSFEIPVPEAPSSLEVPAHEAPSSLEVPVPETPSSFEVPVPEAPSSLEVSVPEIPSSLEVPVPEIPSSFEVPVPETPSSLEVPAPEAPSSLEVPAPETPSSFEAPIPEAPSGAEASVPVASSSPEVSVSVTPSSIDAPASEGPSSFDVPVPPLEEDKENLWRDEWEEFWNVISEPEVPREEKKRWVERLFALDRDRAYTYFLNNIYDFSQEKEIPELVGEVCAAYGLPVIPFHDKAAVREELLDLFSWKVVAFILLLSPFPLVASLFLLKLMGKAENRVADFIFRIFFSQFSPFNRDSKSARRWFRR